MTQSFSTNKFKTTAAENLSSGDVLYINSPGSVRRAIASDPTNIPLIGVAGDDTLQNDIVTVYTGDLYDGYTNLSPGSHYYLSPFTFGAITTSKPVSGVIVNVGDSISDTTLNIHLDTVVDPTVHITNVNITQGITGDIILEGDIDTNYIQASCGNSNEWCSTYSTVQGSSGTWEGDFCGRTIYISNISACSGIINLSGDLNITGSITATNISAVNLSVVNLFTPGSAVTIDTSVIVASSLSANDLYSNYIATSCGNSTEWCSVYSTVCGNSGLWDSTYTTVCSESAANWQNRNLYGFIQTETGTLTADIQADTFILSSLTSGVDVYAVQPDIVTFSVDLSTNQIWHDGENTPFLSGVSGLDDVIDDIYYRLSGQELVIINNSYVQDQGAVANPYVTQPAGTDDPTLADSIINFISWEGTGLFGKEPFKLVSINSTTAPQGATSATGAMRLEDHSNGVVLASSIIFTTNGLEDTQITQWQKLTAFPVNETDLALKLWTPSGPNNREAGCSNFQIIV